MGAPLVLLHGTHGRRDRWFRPESPFAEHARARGFGLLHPSEPFLWSGRVGGLFGFTPGDPDDPRDDRGRLEWANEGRHLTYYCAAFRPGEEVSIVAHSHSGNLAVLAIAYGGLRVRHLVTVSTPIRADMAPWYAIARGAISGHWFHVYGDFWRDWWQKVGELGDLHLGWHREMTHAHLNLYARGHGHSSVLRDGTTFADLGLWDALAT